MELSLKKVDRFHRLKHLIPKLVRQTIHNNEIIHGGRAMNIQMGSPHLRIPTKDFDVYSYKPQESAHDTEEYLDKKFGFDAFETKKGVSPNTYRVRSLATTESVADFTQQKQKIPYKKILGKKYVTLKHIKQHTQKTIRARKATHRIGKDKDMLARIKLNEQQNISW